MASPAPRAPDIDAAWSVVRAHFPVSPLHEHEGVFYKREDLLPTGAFKVRGALAALSGAREKGVDAVIAASAGNHGAGVAWAANALGMQATIVVPKGCPQVKQEKMARYARVLVCDAPGYDETEAIARRRAASEGVPFVSPFDDTAVMAGNGGTLGRELLEQLPALASVFVPVGGGGLLTGLLAAFAERDARPCVVTAQSEVSPAFTRSLEDGRVYETWAPAESLAEGLEGGTGATGVACAARYGVRALELREKAIGSAMLGLRERLGGPVEGSAAVAEAARLAIGDALPGPQVVIVTGGNVDPARLDALRRDDPR